MSDVTVITVSSGSSSVIWMGRQIDIESTAGGSQSLSITQWPQEDARAQVAGGGAREASPVPEEAAAMHTANRDVAATLSLRRLSNPIIDGCSLAETASNILTQSDSQYEAQAAVEEVNQRLASAAEEGSAAEPPEPKRRRAATAELQVGLDERGYVVVPTALANADIRRDLLRRLDAEVKNEWTRREYKAGAFGDTENPMTDETTRLVGGGFAALGNPSSFHSTIVRELRRIAHRAMVDATPFDLRGGFRVSQVIDRLMKRLRGDKPTTESWHRDVAANTKAGDRVYGGWINLDDEDQFFSCIPGTHNDAIGEGTGFVKDLSAADKQKIAEHRSKREKPLVSIPAGHMLIFNERLIHEVVSKSAGRTMLRLFTGWYVAKHDAPHDSRPFDGTTAGTTEEERLRNRLGRQACMFLKSGQAPAMAPMLHWTNNPRLIAGYTDRLRDAATENRPRKPTASKPNPVPAEYRCPHRDEEGCPKKEVWTTLDSLAKMKAKDRFIEMWEPYGQLDLDILLPMDYLKALQIAESFKAGV